MSNKIIEHMTRLCPLSDIMNDPDIFYNIIKDIDDMSKKLKTPKYHQPFYKAYPDFSQKIIISPCSSNSSKWLVSVFVALHENDTELPVNICLCVPGNDVDDDITNSDELSQFVELYRTQVMRLFIDKGYSLMDIFSITGTTFNMDRKTVLKFYNTAVEMYFTDRKKIHTWSD